MTFGLDRLKKEKQKQTICQYLSKLKKTHLSGVLWAVWRIKHLESHQVLF